MPRLKELNQHWDKFPPVHISLTRISRALLTEEAPQPKQGMADFMAEWGNRANG